MSPPELPNDPRHWPNDPFALLGVDRGTSETDIKRAYTRLIRRFKPEHHPDEFRRIREAYDTCVTQGRWFFPTTQFVAPTVSPSSEERPESVEPTTAPEAREARDEPAPEDSVKTEPFEKTEFSQRTSRIDEADRLWALAVDGQSDEAYAGLQRLAETNLDRAELSLRLYWLLALTPSLDATRTRHEWLADALVRSKLSGSAVELYRRELGSDPDAALYGPYLDLLGAESHPHDLLHIGRLRLIAAGRSRSWSPADSDLKSLAKRIPLYDEPAWLNFLASASDWTAWDQPWPLSAHVRDELNRVRHLELAHGESFDRIEETARLAKDWSDVADNLLTLPWQRLVACSWAGYGDVAVSDVKSAVEEVTANPSSALRRFDRFQRDRGLPLLGILSRALERTLRIRGSHDAEFPSDLIRSLAVMLPGGWARGYAQLRSDLLDFLFANAIHPDEFAEACGCHPDYRVREVMQSIHEDLSLRLVWLALTLTV